MQNKENNMSSKMLRCMAYKEGGLWVVVCLDLCLAAQDSSLEDAVNKLNAQIDDYVDEALNDRDFGYQLLNRRAPLSLWAKYYYIKLCVALSNRNKQEQDRKSARGSKLFDIDSSSGCHA
jgi:hypothetical protein